MVRVNHRKPGICHNEVIFKGGARVPLSFTETALLAQKLEQAPTGSEVLVKLPL